MRLFSRPRAPQPVRVEMPLWPITDRGSFTHAFCPSCGWDGPARRARANAAHDAETHELLGCGETTVRGMLDTRHERGVLG